MTAIEAAGERRISYARFGFAIPWKAVRIAGFYLALVCLWEGLAVLQIWPSHAFPPPEDVLADLRRMAQDGTLSAAIQTTMLRMAIGFSLSIAAGLAVGVCIGSVRWVDETVGSLVTGLQSLPSITWFPLAILWFGRSESAIVFVVLMGSVNSIAISSAAGVKGIEPVFQHASKMFGGALHQRLIYVIVPAMLPSIVQGLKLGWSFAWRSLLAAELLFASMSLGHLLSAGREAEDVSQIVSVMVVIVAIGMLVDRLVFGRLEGWVNERWGIARGW
jgi:NitT/TauT family transport system permease protein